MRKINSNSLKSYLSRDEMRSIHGGGTCGAYLPNGGNSTTFQTPNGGATISSGGDVFRGISQSEALQLTQGIAGARWCCNSCSSASWY